jgi:hypothetical protein
MVEVPPKSVRLRKTELYADKRHSMSLAKKKVAG